MKRKFMDNAIIGSAEQALDFIGNILESSTEYSIIGKDLSRKILSWNEGALLGQPYSRRLFIKEGALRIRNSFRALSFTVSILFFCSPSFAAGSDLTNLSLQELMNLEVTSVSKKAEKFTTSPAAIEVITGENIRRSGAVSIPQALRNVPGLDVAQVDSRQWAISSRGFNSTSANKLLVLMDGRAVYTPLYSGIFWDAQDTLMEDLDKIEVIRGPGAALWGANAVNGVINITTKNTKETQGWLATGGYGSEERGFGGLRYGGKVNDNTYYRVYSKHFNRDDSKLINGNGGSDSWDMGQGGFRIDGGDADVNQFTFQGDMYGGNIDQPTNKHILTKGENLVGKWSHTLSDDSEAELRVYYDRTFRNVPGTFLEKLSTYDVEAQHRFQLNDRQEIAWGLGYRYQDDRVRNSAVLAFLPGHLDTQIFSTFVQDEIILLPDLLRLTLGSRFEHNDFSGFEYQPTARLAWTPTSRQTVWTAVSRAVRTPSRIDRDFFVPGAPPFTVLAGGPDFESEELVAYELGYRVQPFDPLFLSLATFYNQYDKLRSIEVGPPPILANTLEGETYGAELSANYQMAEGWLWRAGYTFLQMELHQRSGSTDLTSEGQEGDSPHNQFFLGSFIDLPSHWELDATVRYVDSLPHQHVRAYVAMDVRLGWRPTKNWEFSIVGQNLLDSRHPEFGATPSTQKQIEQSIYGKITWQFS